MGKEEQGSKEIDCQELFKNYWKSTAHEFPVPGQSDHQPVVLTSLTEEAQRTLSLGNMAALWNYNSLQKSLFVLWQLPTVGCLSRSHRRIRYAPRCVHSKEC